MTGPYAAQWGRVSRLANDSVLRQGTQPEEPLREYLARTGGFRQMERVEDRSQAHLLYLLLERVDRLLADTQDTERLH